jgi:3D (Asp-Asp-Asp) domain-containing protein
LAGHLGPIHPSMPMTVALYALAKTLGMKWVTRAGAALLVAAASATLAADQRALLEKIDSDVFGLPAPASAGKPLRLWATWYHIPAVDATAHGFPLVGVDGKPVSPAIPGRHWCMAALQGVVTIKDADGVKRTYTYEKTAPTAEIDCAEYVKGNAAWTRAAGRSRFAVSKGPFGDGAGEYQVVPFRTVAVDTRLIPLGTVLYIPTARGVEITLPSGRKAVHDGYFFASDRGGGVRDNHIDVFVGHWPDNPFPSFVSSTPRRTFDAHVMTDERVTPHLHRLHASD